MFLITDKLEKLEPKYESMKDEKRDLIKEENQTEVLVTSTSHRFDKFHIFYTCLVGAVFFIFVWMMMSPKYYHPHLTNEEDQILKTTMHVIDDAQYIINKVKERSATMSAENKQAATEYVNTIRDLLKERTNLGVQKMNQIISDKMAEIESELISFDSVITEAAKGIVDYSKDDLNTIKDNISKIESGDASESLDKALNDVEKEITSTFEDIDQMYSFYGRYLGDVIVNKVQNATDRVSMMLNSQRKYCDCTVMERINICYNITTQNNEISKLLESTVKVIGILTNTTETVNGLESLFATVDEHTHQFYQESKMTLKNVMRSTRQTLDSLLEDDNNFLGSAITKKSFQTQPHVKRYILRSYRTSIESIAKRFNTTTTDFKIVTTKQKNLIKENLDQALEELGEQIKDKANYINTTARDEFKEKANFASLKTWMQDKIANATEVINSLFESDQAFVAESLKYNLEYIVSQQLPFVSSLSIKNYLPSDVCPLATDYQKFISLTLEEYMRKDQATAIDDMFATNDFFSDDTEVLGPIIQEEMEVEIIIDDPTAESDNAPNETALADNGEQYSDNSVISPLSMGSVMNLVTSIVHNIRNAGFTLQEPVEIYIASDDKK